MNSSTATNTSYSIYDFLKRNDITLSKVINYGTQFDSSTILPNLDFINKEWNNHEHELDQEAMKLLPEKYKIIFASDQFQMETVFLTVHL